jgi:glutathione S-transferase
MVPAAIITEIARMPAYTLYYSPGSASLVVHWLFLDAGLPHELRRLDLEAGEHKQPAYLAINPNGVVPTLLVDGAPMLESSAMVLHLADAHPEARLAPAPGTAARAPYYQWIVIGANGLQPAYRTWFYPGEAASDAAAESAKERARERIEAIWTRLERLTVGALTEADQAATLAGLHRLEDNVLQA